jgi:hypothetical protein
MEKEKELSSQESLELIASMIAKAKNDYQDTGISALFWGTLIPICSLVTFFNYYWQSRVLVHIWLLAFVAFIPQILISARERKLRKYKGYHEDMIGGIWISYAIAVSVMTYIGYVNSVFNANFIFLILYGIPTFATGYAKRFVPMIIGGIACWVFAIVSFYTPWPYFMLYSAAGGLLAWFIPGLILRRRYLKAKRQHV